MQIETDDYVKASTYANLIGKTVRWVYKLIERNELDSIEIDGVKFIKIK